MSSSKAAGEVAPLRVLDSVTGVRKDNPEFHKLRASISSENVENVEDPDALEIVLVVLGVSDENTFVRHLTSPESAESEVEAVELEMDEMEEAVDDEEERAELYLRLGAIGGFFVFLCGSDE